MSPELFRLALDNIKGMSEYLYFHVMGEPLLHPQLGLFLDMCGEYGYKVNLTTNGTMLEKAYGIIGKPALRQVNISLHSDHNSDNYLEKIFDFIDKAKAQTLICLRLWNLSEGSGNKENEEIINKIKAKYSPKVVVEDKPTHVRGIKIAENIFINQSTVFDWPDLTKADIGDNGFCYGLREQIAILVDGTVVPCCLDKDGDLNLGNIQTDSLENIINGSRAKAIYDGFSRKKVVEPLCKKCGYRTRF